MCVYNMYSINICIHIFTLPKAGIFRLNVSNVMSQPIHLAHIGPPRQAAVASRCAESSHLACRAAFGASKLLVAFISPNCWLVVEPPL